MEKEKLNRSKRAVKGTITKLETYIDQTKERNPTELEVKLKRVEQLYKKIDELKDQYYGLKDISDSEITEEETDLEGTVDRLEALEVRIKDILNSLIIKPSIINCKNEIPQADSKTKLEIKLPEIPLPVFHSKFDEWPNFKSQFDNIITKNNDLNDFQKLHYLKGSLLGDAKRLETVDDSFESLLKAVENRFENKRLLTETYVNQILEIEKLANESAGDIRNMVDILKKNIRSLKLLNFDRNNLSDILLLNIILKKHMQIVVEPLDKTASYFLPHHGVLRPDSKTIKLRVVFNASSKTTSGLSLNDILYKDGTIQQDLFSILLRFRQHAYVFTTDISKMYRQILIHPDHRSLQLILWKNSVNDLLQIFKLNTVTYGTSCAPY
nr:uncharacterized protein LOC122272114 [Parasteatoda tepidariorum]